jgi:predicted AlkP superfamily phosphohydrolase/phosphomutase
MNFPAWSTFLTGLEPGRHGLFDFTQKAPEAYRLAFANASDRRGTPFFERVNRAGGRCLVLGVPGTFPPEAVDGLLVSGFDAPVSTGTDPRSASDPELYQRIAERVGPWMRADLDEAADSEDWRISKLFERGQPPDFGGKSCRNNSLPSSNSAIFSGLPSLYQPDHLPWYAPFLNSPSVRFLPLS